MHQVLPILFKLQEPPPYTMVERDTVYTVFEDTLSSKEGMKPCWPLFREN
ncbi:MAG: hypothetical protein IPJ00_06035 [Saprospirales bacterium]|nr:hypothetical protein [Saprospirales bacterium]